MDGRRHERTDLARSAAASAKQPERGDLLSLLPDDVLLYILGRVDLSTAARTSALSTRWRRLPWLLPELDIDANDFISVQQSKPIETNARCNAMHTLTKATKSLFAKPRRESIVRSLRLKIDLIGSSLCGIGPLICDAVNNGLLKDLDLAILDETMLSFSESKMLRPKRAREVDVFFRVYPSVLRCLTRLSLCRLRFVQSDMHRMLFDCCKQLKHLSISHCDTDEWSPWKIDAPNSKLRVLELSMSWFQRIELISLPKLEKLDWDTWPPEDEPLPLSFGFVPSLEELHISNGFNFEKNLLKLSEVLRGATGIHTLALDFRGQNIWVQPEEAKQLTSVFSKLRKLFVHGIFVKFDLLWSTTLLEAAPSVEILDVKVWDHACEEAKGYRRSAPRWELNFGGSKNLLLKELQFVGFRPLEQQLTFIRAILERAPNLQVVVLKKDCKDCKECNAVTLNVPPCSSTQPPFPKNKDEQDMVFRRVTDGTFFSGRIVFCD